MMRFTGFSAISAVLTLAFGGTSGGIASELWQVQASSELAPPPILCVTKATTPAPVLDGKLDDAAWQTAAVIASLSTTAGGPADVRTTVRLTYDDTHLYVAFDCQEPAMDRLVKKAGAGEDKWPGDCVELFLDVNQSRQRYFQFATNSVGAHADFTEGGGGWNGKWQVAAGPTEDGWCAEMAIPWSDLGHSRAPRNIQWGFNVTRHRILGPKDADAGDTSLYTWAPMDNFTNPRLYGTLFFGSAQVHARTARPIQYEATLDKHVYSGHHPVAQLAVAVGSGTIENATVAVELARAEGGQAIKSNTIKLPSSRFGVDIPIQDLAPGEYVVNLVATDRAGNKTPRSLPFKMTAAPAVATEGRVALGQTVTTGADLPRWHVRTGVAFPEGALWDATKVALLGADGKAIAADVRPLATWSKGGSIKWLALDFQSPLQAEQAQKLTVAYGANVAPVQPEKRIDVQQSDQAIRIDTGAATFVLDRKSAGLPEEIWVGQRQLLAKGAPSGPYTVGEDGTTYWATQDPDRKVELEHAGALSAIVRCEGWHVAQGGRRLARYVVRQHFYAGLPYFRLEHTFIIAEDTNQVRYRDIGLRLPVAGGDYRLGVAEGATPAGQSVSLLQKRWDQFVVKNNTAAQKITEGDKAPGWIGRGDLAVVVRDFWQNFPKELEATPDALVVHFWPRHGERVWSAEEEIQPDPAYLLPFVHQGELLDFRMPEAYYTGPLAQEYGFAYPDKKDPEKWNLHYGAGTQRANAMGVAKTHDMLIAFGQAAAPPQLQPLADAFNRGVHFLADPAWTCATGVVGPISPADPLRFPRQEEYLSGGFDYLMRWTWDLTHAYGMFNYGDSYHAYARGTPNLRPSFYRLWAGYHHGRARMPWLLYLRSGDPKYLTWARANAQHLIDVDTCHHDTPEARAWPSASRKLVGGMCDYKGIVHWHAGARVSDYNNMLDFIQLDYYLTGNGRALDTMHEIGQLLITRAKGGVSREASNLGSLLDYYKATFDPAALLVFTQELKRCYAKPAIEHYPPSVQWAPYLEPWIAYSGDEEAKKFLLQLANDILDPAKGNGYHYYGDGRALAMAYSLTGDEKFLLNAWAFYNRGPGLYDAPGAPLRQFVDWLNWSYEGQQCMPVMAILARQPQIVAPGRVPYKGQGPAVHTRRSADSAEIVVQIIEKSDSAFTFGNRFFTRKEVQWELLDPAGKQLQSGKLAPGDSHLSGTQERDGVTGTYTLRVFGPDEYHFVRSNLSSLGMERFLMTGGPEGVPGVPGVRFYANGRWFFFVPPDCESFSFTVGDALPAQRMPDLEIIAPDETIVRKVSLPHDAKPQTIEVRPTPEQRGKVWSIAARQMPIHAVTGIPNWFASTYEAAKP